MNKTLDLCYPKKTQRNGQDSTVWLKCGIVVMKDDGKIAVKLDTIPLGATGDVWFNAMEQKPRNG